jgi:hypothetical protein
MSTLPTGVYANKDEPLWASAYGTNNNITANSVTLTGSPPLVLTNTGGVLKQNGSSDILTSLWSTTPATSNKIYMDATHILSNIGGNLYFDGNLLADASAVPNIADWSLYPALSNINMNSQSISNSTGYSGTGNISTSSGVVSGTTGTFTTTNTATINGTGSLGALAIASGNQITMTDTRLSNTSSVDTRFIVDSGANIGNTADFVVETKRGNRGRILMTADGGFSNGLYGEINLTANGSSTSVGPISYATGGLINLTATTPVATSNTSTSAIKLSASSVLSYAGAVSPVFSTAGYNYVYGQVGVSVVCASTPPVIPSLVNSVYIYSGSGTRISNQLYTDVIKNIGSGDPLLITAQSFGSYVNITEVGNITGTQVLGSNAGIISQMSNISTSNLNTSTINNAVYTPTSNWSTFPATTNLNMSNFSISNANALSSSTSLTLGGQGVAVNSTGNNNISFTASGTGDINLTSGTTGDINIASGTTSGDINLTATDTGIIKLTAGTGINGRVELNRTRFTSRVDRLLGGGDITQPIFQYGSISSTGNSGNQLITFTAYTSTGQYFIQVSMEDTNPAQMSVNKLSTSSARIYWASAGVGSHTITWLAYGV